MTQGEPPARPPHGLRRHIVALAWPVAAEMALQTATQMVDMVMVGRLGPEAIAAVGLSFRPVFIPYAGVLGFGAGVAAVIARHIGAGEHRQASRAAAQAILSFAMVAVAVSLGFFIWATRIMTLMGATGEVVDMGRLYLWGLSPGLGFLFLALTMTFALRGAGDTKTPLKVNALANVLNVFLNWVLIFGHLGFPALGLLGAGLATSIARTMAAISLLVFMLRGSSGLNLLAADFARLDTNVIRRMLRIGLPAIVERLNLSTAQAVHLRIVAALGTTAVASATVASMVELISFMPAIGFSVAAATTVGQSLGASQPERAQAYAWESTRVCAVFMGFMGLLFGLFPGILVRAFTGDPVVAGQGAMLLRIVAFSQVFTGIGHTLAGALRGAGDTRTVFLVTVAASWGVRVAMAALMVRMGLGLTGAWIAILLDWIVQAAGTAWFFRRGKWKGMVL
ncbi:MAG: MATE family efflux transporter [Bacillota bacterium]